MADQLQRSAISFRRQGSSGLIWDHNFLSGELNRFSQPKPPSANADPVQTAENEESNTTIRPVNTVRRNRSRNGAELVPEPPSPRVRVCGLCRVFGKGNKSHARTGSRKRGIV
ncbi:hypothetical protein HanLR1_Chr10g0368351 [Helianthus annuus]|nr:hypothetical protein HanLR1_Chr10g0368351 [Helianthus annuus]